MTTTAKVIQIEDVKTDKYGNKIDPLSNDEYEALKKSIAEHGFNKHYPIIINQYGDVLDGHHRFKICKELGIESEYVVNENLKNEFEEIQFVHRINRNRRHMNDYQKIVDALKERDSLEDKAKQNMSLASKGVKHLTPLAGRRVDEEIGKLAGGKSHIQVFKVRKIEEKAPEEVKESLKRGRTTISKQYNKIKNEEKHAKIQAEIEKATKGLKLPSKVILLNKDSTKVDELTEIKDNSLDLIVTDPPYSTDSLPLYEGLAKLAWKKLRDGGSIVFYFGRQMRYEIEGYFRDQGFNLRNSLLIPVIHEGIGDVYRPMGVINKHKLMFWFVKGNKRLTNNLIEDVIYSKKPDKTKHPWAQSTVEAEYIIRNLTLSEFSLVLDPFLGAGTFAIPAIQLGRYFVGIEVDKQTFEYAKNNINITINNSTTSTTKEMEK